MESLLLAKELGCSIAFIAGIKIPTARLVGMGSEITLGASPRRTP